MANGVGTVNGAPPHGGTAERTPLEWLRRLGLPILALLLVLIPIALSEFRLNLLAKYLCFAFPAIGIVLIWGYGGILSLGQGIFFGLGNYMMAMYLKLESTGSDSSAQALAEFFGSKLPDFMVWNSVESLPWWLIAALAFVLFATIFLLVSVWLLARIAFPDPDHADASASCNRLSSS